MDKETILIVDDEKEIRDLVDIYIRNVRRYQRAIFRAVKTKGEKMSLRYWLKILTAWQIK